MEHKATRAEDRYVPRRQSGRAAVVGPLGGGEIDQANNISHGKNKLSHEKYRENKSMELFG